MNHLSDWRITSLCLLIVWTATCSSGLFAAIKQKQELDHVFIDGVKLPFDETVEIVGICQSADSFRFRNPFAHASLLGLRIQQRANQEGIAFYLRGKTDALDKKLESLEKDSYFKVRGRIGGVRLSGPNRVCNFTVESIESVPAAPLMPSEFVDREASFEGVAVAKGAVKIHQETLQLDGLQAWPENVIGKRVLVQGLVSSSDKKTWQLSKPTWKFVNLADMESQEVSLDGTLWSLNGHWWFDYRGERLYLTKAYGPPLTFPGAHGRTATASGNLVRQLRPSLDQITSKVDRDLVPTYVVRGAKVTFRDDSKTWTDRFGTVYPKRNKVQDGVPELIAESSFRRNIIGNETRTMLFKERNFAAISEIVHDATPAVRSIIAGRMNDAQVNSSLRLLYAAILARVNDERGREFLRTSAESPGELSQEEIYYCLGIFPFLAAIENDETETNCKWAEKTLVAIMTKPDSAKVASKFSFIPSVLIRINSPASRKTLLDYVLRSDGEAESFFTGPSITSLLCHPSTKLSAEDLLAIEAVTEDEGTRRQILRALLRLKHPAAAERFLKDLKGGFAYMDFRDSSSPEVLAALKPQLSNVTGETKSHVQMLLVLGEQDPVPPLLALLNDPKFRDKNLVMFELARIADPRAVSPVARVLRNEPDGYFKTDSTLATTTSIEHALKVLANTRNREAVKELIELIGADLGRFGGYIDRAGLQRIVAAHLIEITGESFGVDQAGWHAWEQAQPDERFDPAEPAQNKPGSLSTGPDARVDLGG